MKSLIRSIKNEIYNYSEGECLVRELTSDEAKPPSTQQLIKLKIMLTEPAFDYLSVRMLFNRLKDYDNIRHVTKSLICIEYLIKNADRKFVRYCKTYKECITKLTLYKYVMDNCNHDYGEIVRTKAKRIVQLLSSSKILRAERAKTGADSQNCSQHSYLENWSPQKNKKVKEKKTEEPEHDSFMNIPAGENWWQPEQKEQMGMYML
eukprot:UN05291